MPYDIDFSDPRLPNRANPELDPARSRNLTWARSHGLVHDSDRAAAAYLSMKLAEIMGVLHPDPTGEDFDLVIAAATWLIVLDDQFDGPLGQEPQIARAVCEDLIASTYRPPGTPAPPNPRYGTAWTDIMDRTAQAMPSSWYRRAMIPWRNFFRHYLYETLHRSAGIVPSVDTLLRIRRPGIAAPVGFMLIERGERFETPECVLYSPHIQAMEQLCIEVIICVNDINSLEVEDGRDDVHNLVVVLQHEQGCTRQAAIQTLRAWVPERYEQFLQLQDALPPLWDALHLTKDERNRAEQYIEGLRRYLGSTQHWYTDNQRFEVGGTTSAALYSNPTWLMDAYQKNPQTAADS
ncbi:hypothetical protein AB0L75_28110 [Streptomyces sp. NPDC052101]|uniref:terpene synthase family protein n=1 Tax=Streptomyces sp. NPDC052101 TaxID=3155763 RepID=UPI00342ECF4F